MIIIRLWHKDLITVLPRQQLLGQWRECCLIAKNLAEKGTPNHVLVNRVTEYPKEYFIIYCYMIIGEMTRRDYDVNIERIAGYFEIEDTEKANDLASDMSLNLNSMIFAGWHTERYLRQCLCNLQEKYDCGAIPEEEWKLIVQRYPAFK